MSRRRFGAKEEVPEVSATTPVTGDVAPVNFDPPPPPPVEPVKSVGERKVSLEAYCSQMNVPERRRAGMRAFTKVTRATVAEWAAIFAQY